MGDFLNAFKEGWNDGKERAKKGSYRRQDKINIPVKVIEPSEGRIVKLEVTETKECYAKIYMDQLIVYAESLEQCGVHWSVSDKIIQIAFPDGDMAEKARKLWRK